MLIEYYGEFKQCEYKATKAESQLLLDLRIDNYKLLNLKSNNILFISLRHIPLKIPDYDSSIMTIGIKEIFDNDPLGEMMTYLDEVFI